jgi:serine/threonine-protein kinase
MPIPGTEGAIHPFFSPDGRWIGFLTNDKVKKVSLRGGAPVTICDAQSPDRAMWTRDDLIYFLADEKVLWSVPAGRGAPREIMRFTGALGYNFDQVLPDGKSALLTDSGKRSSADYADIVLMSIKSRQVKVLVSSGYAARYVPPGYLLFARAGSLLAVRFDPSRGQVRGEPVTVVTGVSMNSFFHQAQVAVSENGLLVYVPGGDRVRGRLALVDRKGESEFLDAPARLYGAVDLAPGGDRLAVQVSDLEDYIWIYDLKRREGRNLFAESAGYPVWSADGGRVAFARPGEGTIWTQTTVGREPPVQVVSETARPSSWSPDGTVLALYTLVGERRRLGFVRLGEKPEWIQRANADEMMPDFSPDGRWVAYGSTEGGAHEIWVRSYPDGKTARQVSVDGGIEPVWCPSGELFYRKGDRWMGTRVSVQPELSWEPTRLAFETDFVDTPGRSYDVTPDGRRLLVVKPAEPQTLDKIHLISNWLAVFERSERAV